MKRIKAAAGLLTAALLAVSMLSACSGGGAGQPADTSTPAPAEAQAPEDSGQTAEPAAPSGDAVTLRFFWWGGDRRHQLTLEALALYEEQNPNVKIEAEYQGMDGYQQKLMTQLAGGTAPDIFQVDPPWLLDIGQGDFLLDLNTTSYLDQTQFEPKILESFCTIDGKLLGMPTGSNGAPFTANKDFLDKFGISPDIQWTWEEFIAKGKEIHEQDPESYLTAWDPEESEFFVSEYYRMKHGKPWITDDFEINATVEEMTEAYTVLSDIYTSGTSMPMGEVQPFITKMDQHPKWINGQIGGYVDWVSKTGMWKSSVDYDIVLLNVPTVAGGKDNSLRFRPTQILSVNNASANVDEACKLFNWFLNAPEAYMILQDCRSAPTSRIALDTLNEANLIDQDMSKFLDGVMANPASADPYVTGDAEIFSFLMDEFQNVAYGNYTPQKAAEELLARTQDKLDALKAAR